MKNWILFSMACLSLNVAIAQDDIIGATNESYDEDNKQLITHWFSYGFGISNGGMIGVPVRAYSPTRKTAIELGAYFQPDYTDRWDVDRVTVMIMGGPIFYGKQRFHRAKVNAKGNSLSSDRISQSGIGVKIGMNSNKTKDYLAAVCWSYEYFLQHNPSKSFNLELGLGGSIQQSAPDANGFSSETLEPLLFFKISYNIYGRKSQIVEKPAYILIY